MPELKEGTVYNTWQDAEHVRGILRRTTLADYLDPEPHWQTIIDYDALAKQDKQEWVANGLNCLFPGNSLCLVSLSAGGEDADTLREFDLKTGKFVEHGFVLPHSKQTVDLAGQRFAPGRPGLGCGHDDQIGLSICGEAVEARPAAGSGEGGFPRHRKRCRCLGLDAE